MSSQVYANVMKTTGGKALVMLTVSMDYTQGLSGLARCALSGHGKKQENV
jgi:hypothetical protein